MGETLQKWEMFNLNCEINEALQRICHLLLSSPTETFPKIITTINLSETPLNQLLI